MKRIVQLDFENDEDIDTFLKLIETNKEYGMCVAAPGDPWSWNGFPIISAYEAWEITSE